MDDRAFEYFTAFAMQGLSIQQARRVRIALDCAIVFGAYQARTGNESLTVPLGELNDAFADKMDRLEKLST